MDHPGEPQSPPRPAWASRKECDAACDAFFIGEAAVRFVYAGVLADIEEDRRAGRPRLLRWASTLSVPVPPVEPAVDGWLGLRPALGDGDPWDLERLGWMLGTWGSGRDVVLRVAGRRLHHHPPPPPGAPTPLGRCLTGYGYDGGIGTPDEAARSGSEKMGGGHQRDRELARHALTLARRAAAGEWRLGLIDLLATGPAARLASAQEQAVDRARAAHRRRVRGRE